MFLVKIPGLSDFAGAALGQREPKAESNGFSVAGAVVRGGVVKGVFGTIDGIASVATDPYEAIEGLNSILMNPEETIPA